MKTKFQIRLEEMEKKYENAIAADPQQEDKLRDSWAVEKLKYLGNEKRLFSIEITYKDHQKTKLYRIINLESSAVLEFRKNIFTAGIMVVLDPNKWEVFPPSAVEKIIVNRQSKYFSE